MMHRSMLLLATLSAVAVPAATAAERHIAREALPLPVAATVDAQTKGATIKCYLTEVENSKRVYEAETAVDGHTRDLQIAPDGTLNEVEEEVAFDRLPAAVQSSLRQRANGAQIVKVESLTKHEKLVAYEASTRKGTKKSEVQVGPDGGQLQHEE